MDLKPSSFLAAFICCFLKMVSYPFIVLGRTKEQGAARGSEGRGNGGIQQAGGVGVGLKRPQIARINTDSFAK